MNNIFNRGKIIEKETVGVLSKGQMFIIASVIMILGLVMLKNILGIYITVEEKRYHETSLLEKQLRNIKGEYERITGLSTLTQNGISHLSDFSSLVPGKKLWVFVWVNGSLYNVTIGNFIGDKINCTLDATSSTPSGYYIGTLNDGEYATREFQTSASEVILTLSYYQQSTRITESIEIKAQENSATCFFDLSLEKKDMLVRTKDIYKVMR